MEQGELWETESDGKPSAEKESMDKEFYDIQNSRESFLKKKMDRFIKAGTLDYKSNVDKAFREIFDMVLLFLQTFEETVPLDALNKGLKESKEIHALAVNDFKQRITEALEAYIQEKESADA
jgi:hypothetical protein